MRPVHLWAWLALSAVWIGGATARLDPIIAMARIQEAEARMPAAARPPDAGDFYRPPEEARRVAVRWQQRQASIWSLERASAKLRRFFVIAVLPPVAGLLGLYLLSLLRPRRRSRRAAAPTEMRRIEYERLKAMGFDTRRVIERRPVGKDRR